MKLFKSAFSRLHFVIMVFALATILLGIVLALPSVPNGLWNAADIVHLIVGITLVAAAVLVPLTMKNRGMVFRALWSRLVISKKDLKQRKPLVLISKAAAMLMALGFLILFLDAVIYKLFGGGLLLAFHLKFIYVMPALAVLHVITMKLAEVRHSPKTKPTR